MAGKGNRYDTVRGTNRPKVGGKVSQISDLIGKVIASMQNQNVAQGYSGGGGSGSSAAAAVSTLAGLPDTPVVKDLIARGIIREGMAPETALAIIAMQGLKTGVGVDIDALMKSVEAMYANNTGDILTAGQQWMQDLYGTNFDPNDPNAALFAQDPLFSSYAGGMAQLDETSDLNQATDLAWFEKNKAAYQGYYDAMMAAASAGTLGIGGSGSGVGGGGYGGGRRRGGGSGGGSGSEEGMFDVPEVDITETESDRSIASEDFEWDYPGWKQALLATARTPAEQEIIWEAISRAHNPDEMAAYLMDEFQTTETAIEEAGLINTGNEAWMAGLPTALDAQLGQYTDITGATYDPETGEIVRPETPPVLSGPLPENMGDLEQLFNQAYTMTPELERAEAIRKAIHASSGFQNIFGLNERNPYEVPTTAPVEFPEIDPWVQQENPNAGEQTMTYNTDEGGYGIDYGVAPDMINRNLRDGAVYSYLQGLSPEERYQYLGEHYDEIMGEGGSPDQLALWFQDNPSTDADILQAVAYAQQRTDPTDTHSNSFFFSNAYNGMSLEEQQAIDQALNSEGINTPNSTLQQAAARRLQQALQTEAARNTQTSIFDRTIGAIPIFGRSAAEGMETVMANQVAEDEADLLHVGSSGVRPDLVATMQEQSRGKYADAIPEGMTPQQYNELVAPGTYWIPPTMDEAAVGEAELDLDYLTRLMRDNMLRSESYQMNQTSADLTDSVMEQTQMRMNSDVESIPWAEALTGVGDPNTAPLELLDPAPDLGGGGEYVQVRRINKPKTVGKTGQIQSKQPSLKGLAAKSLGKTLKPKKKVSKGKYG